MWTDRLSPDEAEQLLALVAAATAADGVPPLNEEARFALHDGSAEHFLAHSSPEVPEPARAIASPESDESGGPVVAGYLQWSPKHRTAQLVVHPDHRRRGIGRRLLAELGDRQSQGTWAFGDLPAARAFAAALDLAPARGLLIMERTLAGIEPPRPPDGLTLRTFRPADADAVLAVNAAAFAHHPEQGSLDATGLAARMAESWFDPSGLILGFDTEGLAGFHWTKRVDAATGEVYVMAVAPRTQGRGYGKALLTAGLHHLRETGCARVLLYVDMAEPVAVRMYESAGFRVAHRDVLYAPTTGAHHDLG